MLLMDKNSMCYGKVPFRRKISAQRVAKKFNQRVYLCPLCYCWHNTSTRDWKGYNRKTRIRLKELRTTVSQLDVELRHTRCEDELTYVWKKK